MTEPDVAITDFALAVESAAFVAVLVRRGALQFSMGRWLLVFFASVGTASLCGGLVHGFFLTHPFGDEVIWPATLLAIGTATLAKWAVGAEMLFSRRVAHAVIIIASIQFAAYAVAAIFYVRDFWIAVADNLPGALFLMIAFAVAAKKTRDGRLFCGALGMALTITAGLLQQQRVGLHPTYFNHNAVYHMLQGIALFLVFVGAYRLVQTRRMPAAGSGATHANAS
jgi:hypothetical protein